MAENGVADGLAEEAAEGAPHCELEEMSGTARWQTSLPHLSRRSSERRARETGQWVASHVRPERRHHPPGGPGQRRRALRKVRKSLVGRYYQLLSGHAAVGSFLYERMTGPFHRESSECRWCGSGKRESHHHLSWSARPGPPRSGGCGSGWLRTADGGTPRRRR